MPPGPVRFDVDEISHSARRRGQACTRNSCACRLRASPFVRDWNSWGHPALPSDPIRSQPSSMGMLRPSRDHRPLDAASARLGLNDCAAQPACSDVDVERRRANCPAVELGQEQESVRPLGELRVDRWPRIWRLGSVRPPGIASPDRTPTYAAAPSGPITWIVRPSMGSLLDDGCRIGREHGNRDIGLCAGPRWLVHP